jgi:hypothetical protein
MDTPVRLHLGSGPTARVIDDPVARLQQYVEEEGRRYLAYEPITLSDEIRPEDLAVTLLINSQAGYRAFKSIQDRGPSITLARLPRTTLETSTPDERAVVSTLIATVASWPGFASSLATKVLHKKRPALIPILDNQAIFGAYLSAAWPRRRAAADSVRDEQRISAALDAIAFDVSRPENEALWPVLATIEPDRTRIELFDMIWWVHFRDAQPVRPATT